MSSVRLRTISLNPAARYHLASRLLFVLAFAIAFIAVGFIGHWCEGELGSPDFAPQRPIVRLVLGAPIGIIFAFMAKHWNDHYEKRTDLHGWHYGLIGIVYGMSGALSIVAFFGIQLANGYRDPSAREVAFPIIEVETHHARSTFYSLIVRDGDTTPDILWGVYLPTKALLPGSCLTAEEGKGSLGFKWIARKQIAPCA